MKATSGWAIISGRASEFRRVPADLATGHDSGGGPSLRRLPVDASIDGDGRVLRDAHASGHPIQGDPEKADAVGDATDEDLLIRSITHGVELRLRRIVIWNEEKQEKLVFLSNHMSFAASTIEIGRAHV